MVDVDHSCSINSVLHAGVSLFCCAAFWYLIPHLVYWLASQSKAWSAIAEVYVLAFPTKILSTISHGARALHHDSVGSIETGVWSQYDGLIVCRAGKKDVASGRDLRTMAAPDAG